VKCVELERPAHAWDRVRKLAATAGAALR
jgi:hypothetical protein